MQNGTITTKDSFLFDFIVSEMKANKTEVFTQEILNNAYRKMVAFFQDKDEMDKLKSFVKSIVDKQANPGN